MTRPRPRPATQSGPENRGYLARIHVAETEEKAIQNAKQFMWMQGEFTGLAHPVWANPSGYFSPGGRRNFVEFAVGRAKNPRGNPTFEDQRADGMIMCGTPKQVLPRIRHLLEETRPGILAVWGNDGNVSYRGFQDLHPPARQEVFPQVREWAKELDLKSPFEAEAPVSIAYSNDLAPPKDKKPAARKKSA